MVEETISEPGPAGSLGEVVSMTEVIVSTPNPDTPDESSNGMSARGTPRLVATSLSQSSMSHDMSPIATPTSNTQSFS